jgi:hypothetical protein
MVKKMQIPQEQSFSVQDHNKVDKEKVWYL